MLLLSIFSIVFISCAGDEANSKTEEGNENLEAEETTDQDAQNSGNKEIADEQNKEIPENVDPEDLPQAVTIIGVMKTGSDVMQLSQKPEEVEPEPLLKSPNQVPSLTLEAFAYELFTYNEKQKRWFYNRNKPTIIDFYAHWCGPCRAMHPIFQELHKKFGDQIHFYKVNVDAENEMANWLGIQSIPAFMFIADDGMIDMTIGGMDQEQFENEIVTRFNTQ